MTEKNKPTGTTAGSKTENNGMESKVSDYPGTMPKNTNFNNRQSTGKKPPAGSKSDSGAKIAQVENWMLGKYELRYNVVKNAVEYREEGSGEPFRDLDERGAKLIESGLLHAGFNGVQRLLEVILASAPDFDPIAEYLENLPAWDESTDHIDCLAGFVKIGSDRREWFNLMFKKHIVRSLACALGHISFNKHCLVFVSGQNDGKTTFLRYLCPPAWSEYYTEDIDFENKDGLVALARNLFINLDELRNLSRQDINKVKSFLTKDTVKARLPFDRRETKLKRRASFFGSTNNAEFLVDETGNVRWLVFEIDGIEHDHGGPNGYQAQVNIDTVYAQAYALIRQGFHYILTRDEIEKSEAYNQAHTKKSLEYELVLKYYEISDNPKDFIPPSEIKKYLEAVEQMKLGSVEMIGKALRQIGVTRRPKKVMGQVVYGYGLKCTGAKEWGELPDEGEGAKDADEKTPF